jgi:thymidylate synthase ThyX
MITDQIQVLDHGYVKLIESWGSDERIIEAARMSTNKSFKGWGCPEHWQATLKIPEADQRWFDAPYDLYLSKLLVTTSKKNPNCEFASMAEATSAAEIYSERYSIPKQSFSITKVDAAVGDEKLLSFLWKNQHYTPFEMAGMIIEVQAPIFVFREWHRHRTQSYNELSARYTLFAISGFGMHHTQSSVRTAVAPGGC